MDPSNTIFNFLNTIPIPTIILANLKNLIVRITTLLALLNHGFDSVMSPSPLFWSSENYDFIIVGGGSAGAVVSNRLSANPNCKVLLLEAGGNPTVLNSIPAMATYNLHHPDTDWMTPSEPLTTSCFACKDNVRNFKICQSPCKKSNFHELFIQLMTSFHPLFIDKNVVIYCRSITIVRGKILGGSSSLNLMVYMRGNPNDFDNWANLTGDVSWSYENVLPYFKKSEDYTGNYPDRIMELGGPLSVTAKPDDPLTRDWMSAAREMGFNNSDANAYQTSTFFPVDHTTKDGRRWSTYKAFIQPVLHRSNFKVIRYAHVTQVNFDSTKRAEGVTYIKNGRTFSVTASKEVILSAGAIGSPHLLMLSGIGHSDHLESFGIPTISNLAVGDNLQDHVLSLTGPFILNDTVSYISDRDFSMGTAELYLRNHSGPLAFSAISALGLFSTAQPPEPNWPNLFAIFYPVGTHNSLGEDFDFLLGLKEGTMKSYANGFMGKDATLVGFNLGRPKSRGTIRLRSANPLDKPVVDLNYYSHPDDMKEMISGKIYFHTNVRDYKLLEETEAFGKYNATLIPNHFPGCESHTLRTDEYYECFLRHLTGTTWHQSCSAKMGRADDPNAVLDSQLRVRGVKGLRVADASIMPRITNANPNAPVIMIGEKAASMILDDWEKGSEF
ncbi:oxygen-dependent choline dehydrogenase-like [Folsomia candida]|uniref:oxygen-dependent choline dehydrogenase-like n=1 Tax=Folsomia candida TaxID=158441 RepID=UPI0016052AB4|nr:oxygen-dependent choline dehydrogenase-like [Folsomia candida]